jgi:hypothetical protein
VIEESLREIQPVEHGGWNRVGISGKDRRHAGNDACVAFERVGVPRAFLVRLGQGQDKRRQLGGGRRIAEPALAGQFHQPQAGFRQGGDYRRRQLADRRERRQDVGDMSQTAGRLLWFIDRLQIGEVEPQVCLQAEERRRGVTPGGEAPGVGMHAFGERQAGGTALAAR